MINIALHYCEVKKMFSVVQDVIVFLFPIPPLLQNHFSIAAVPIHPSTHSMRVGSVFKICDWQILIQILNSHFGQPIVYGWAAYSRLCQLLGKMQNCVKFKVPPLLKINQLCSFNHFSLNFCKLKVQGSKWPCWSTNWAIDGQLSHGLAVGFDHPWDDGASDRNNDDDGGGGDGVEGSCDDGEVSQLSHGFVVCFDHPREGVPITIYCFNKICLHSFWPTNGKNILLWVKLMTQVYFLQIQTFCQRKTSHTSWKASQCFASFETSLAPWFLWSLLSSHRGAARNTGQELQTLRLHKMKSFVFVFAALALFCLQIWVGYLLRLFLEWAH